MDLLEIDFERSEEVSLFEEMSNPKDSETPELYFSEKEL